MRTKIFVAFMDKHPINTGHTLVATKKHYRDIMSMSPFGAGRLFELSARVAKAIAKATGCDGVNIGQSNGKAASQQIFHVHVHVIPRYIGDSPDGSWPRRKRTSFLALHKMSRKIRQSLLRPV